MTPPEGYIAAIASGELAVFEAAIINTCAEHEREHWGDKDYRRCVTTQGYFVKFDNYQSLHPQAETQKYICECVKLDSSRAPCVLEYLELIHTPIPDLPQRVAPALQWLHDLPTPPGDVRIGPLGNGHARHALFKDNTAPLAFTSIEAIERYLNHAIKLIPRRARPATAVSVSHERLVFTQSDMDKSNFGVDDKGMTCLFDFGEVGLLPESLASYTMSSTAPFTAAVANYLGWPSCPSLSSMRRISGHLWIYADPTLGLDENGYRKGA